MALQLSCCLAHALVGFGRDVDRYQAVAGIVFLLLPLEAWAVLIGWAMYDNITPMRIGAGFGGPLLGAFIVYAALPGQIDDEARSAFAE